jgi:hypothetical protein
MEDAYAREINEVLDFFGTNKDCGLTTEQVFEKQVLYGKNGTIPSSFFAVVTSISPKHNSQSYPLKSRNPSWNP